MSETGIVRKMWTYFKRGKTELYFMLTIYNTFLIGGIDLKLAIILSVFAVSSLVVGKYLIKRVDTTNPFVNPFQQDSIEASILFYSSCIDWMYGDLDKAREKMEMALDLRTKWMDEG